MAQKKLRKAQLLILKPEWDTIARFRLMGRSASLPTTKAVSFQVQLTQLNVTLR